MVLPPASRTRCACAVRARIRSTGSTCSTQGGSGASDVSTSSAVTDNNSYHWPETGQSLIATRWYRITESMPSGWSLDSISCSGSTATPVVDLANNRVFVAARDFTGCRCPMHLHERWAAARHPAYPQVRLPYRNGPSQNGLVALQGATFRIYQDNGNGNFQPGTDSEVASSPTGQTNASGYVDVSLPAGQYWVIENTSPTGWDAILETAWGGGSQRQSVRPRLCPPLHRQQQPDDDH